MTPQQRAARKAAELAAAIAALTLGDAVGMALRDHRRRLGLSQRAYATLRDMAASTIARLECSAGRFSLNEISTALEGTGFALALIRVTDPRGTNSVSAIVEPGSWPETELLARVRDGSRRFPAHHDTRAVTNPPNWWWHREFFVGKGPEPQWYAPRPGSVHTTGPRPDEPAGRDAA